MAATNWDIYDSLYKQNETFEGEEADCKEKSVSSRSNTTDTGNSNFSWYFSSFNF